MVMQVGHPFGDDPYVCKWPFLAFKFNKREV